MAGSPAQRLPSVAMPPTNAVCSINRRRVISCVMGDLWGWLMKSLIVAPSGCHGLQTCLLFYAPERTKTRL